MVMRLQRLPRRFYMRPTLTVARDLLGSFLCRRFGRKLLIARIVEVEAYLGSRDPASHAYRGETRRNEVMFREGGHLYVYFTYGMHYCSNVVTERQGKGMAVLLRAAEPIEGLERMMNNRYGSSRQRRSVSGDRLLLDLCRGPARLCEAFGIGRESNGVDLCGNDIWIATEPGPKRLPRIRRSPRIGISQGAHHRWRFFLEGARYVSHQKAGHGTRKIRSQL